MPRLLLLRPSVHRPARRPRPTKSCHDDDSWVSLVTSVPRRLVGLRQSGIGHRGTQSWNWSGLTKEDGLPNQGGPSSRFSIASCIAYRRRNQDWHRLLDTNARREAAVGCSQGDAFGRAPLALSPL